MILKDLRLLLADDDQDDCFLFKEALADIHFALKISTVHDGDALMKSLKKANELPDLLFLDLNMPKKNGIECLTEIKDSVELNRLPVIIYSTSLDHATVKLLYAKGALYYIRKPATFNKLKQVIHLALSLVEKNAFSQPHPENFVINI